WLADLLRANRISGGTYIEPYAGGAGAAIHLLSTGIVDRIVINDADFAVYAFWKAVLDETDAFITRVERCKVSIGRWE
uniref:DNA adenine methylase n=2 Tax=Gammaproteobacteria TaxID=1236 RepID=UPI00203FF2F1